MSKIRDKAGWFTLEDRTPQDLEAIVFFDRCAYRGKHRVIQGAVFEGLIHIEGSTPHEVSDIYLWRPAPVFAFE